MDVTNLEIEYYQNKILGSRIYMYNTRFLFWVQIATK